jgi:PAS domain S-box-containing protein
MSMQLAELPPLSVRPPESDLTDLYENAPCGYHSLDAQGVVVRMNATELAWLGYRRDEIVGRVKLSALVSPACRRHFEAAFEALKVAGSKSEVESELARKDGSILPVQLNAVAIVDRRGRFVQTHASVTDITDRRRVEQQARRYALELQALSRRLVEAQDHERRRLADELHDRIGQNLTALNLNLTTIRHGLSPGSAERIGARVEDCLRLVEATVERTFDLMAELRPAVLDDYGLTATLRWYGEQLSRHTGLEVRVTGSDPVPRLPQAVETTLFRIAQEACINSAKYAKAKSIAIEVASVPGRVLLQIADDGRGFDPDRIALHRTRHGWGLLIMRERARSAGGWLAIDSAIGNGTCIRVEIGR